MTLRLGLIGHPVAHSLSPLLHSAWIAEAGLNARYDAIDVSPETSGRDLLELLVAERLSGVNLTVPFKERVVPELDSLGPMATACGAVNTIVYRDGQWIGSNTDAQGFVDSVEGAGHAIPPSVLILGAGGAARAVAAGCATHGARSIHLLNRDVDRARRAARALTSHFPKIDLSAGPYEMFDHAASNAELIVCAVSGPGLGAIAALDPLAVPDGALWVDLNYWLAAPPLMQVLRERGNPVLSGLGMLVHQAARAFEAFTGHPADPVRGFAAVGMVSPT